MVVSLDNGLPADRHELSATATKVQDASRSLMHAPFNFEFGPCPAMGKAMTRLRGETKIICRLSPAVRRVLFMLHFMDSDCQICGR